MNLVAHSVEEVESLGTQIGTIMGIILSVLIVVAFLFFLVVAFIYLVKSSNKEHEFIATLDEHDKAVVISYNQSKHVYFHELFKRGVKHEKE